MLPIIYNESSLINPFIIGHLPQSQNSLILASDKTISNYDNFLNKIVVNNNDIEVKSNCIFARALEFQGDIIITIVFTTENIEAESGRKGLHLTLGATFNKMIFNKFIPCESFFEFFLVRFEDTFDLDLSTDGASVFLELLAKEEDASKLNQKLEFLYRDLSAVFFILEKRITPFSTKFFNLLNIPKHRRLSIFKKRSTFPQVILTTVEENKLEYIYFYLCAVDNHLQTFSSIESSTLNGVEGIHLKIFPVLPNGLIHSKKSKLFFSKKNKMSIALYQ